MYLHKPFPSVRSLRTLDELAHTAAAAHYPRVMCPGRDVRGVTVRAAPRVWQTGSTGKRPVTAPRKLPHCTALDSVRQRTNLHEQDCIAPHFGVGSFWARVRNSGRRYETANQPGGNDADGPCPQCQAGSGQAPLPTPTVCDFRRASSFCRLCNCGERGGESARNLTGARPPTRPVNGSPLSSLDAARRHGSSRSTAEGGRSPSAPPRPPREPRARRGRLVRDGVAQLDGADRMDIKSGSGGGLSIEKHGVISGELGALWAWPVPTLHEPVLQ